MTKKELIDQIIQAAASHGRPNLTHADVEAVVNGLAEVAGRQLARGHDFTVPGIAKFKAVEVAARERRNPATREAVHVPAHLAVKAKPVKALLDAVKMPMEAQ